MVQQETVTIHLASDASGPPQAIEVPRRIGQVRLGEMLGEGGGGVVFQGFDELLHRKVAVKLLHRRKDRLSDAAMAELARGLKSTARIKHPNIVTIYNVESVSGMPAVIMELIEGASLREVLTRMGAFDVPLACYVMRSVGSAVETLHGAGVVHRDVKPANILMDREGYAHVCDFGLACEFDQSSFGGKAGQVGGSPLYMAPEMFDGHVSAQSDVYAMGVMFYELLVGSPPFSGETISDVKSLHIAKPLPVAGLRRRQVPLEVSEILERCLHKQRYLRFKTAAHVMRALEELPPLGVADEVLRRRVADCMVSLRGPAPASPAAAQPGPAAAMTTFDLIAQRAKEKRQDR